jgi:spore germination protein YaaH
MAIKLREDNPYVTGSIIKLKDGTMLLERVPIVYNFTGEEKFKKVGEGDTLQDIAFNFFKNSKYWWIIADVNSIINPFELNVGVSLTIPDIKGIKIRL